MTTLTQSDITAAPAGYSFHIVDAHNTDDNRCFWIVIKSEQNERKVIISSYALFSSFYIVPLFKRDENGAIVFDLSAFDAWAVRNNFDSIRPIPDSEFPEGGMTRYHTHFNEVSKKWELPNIETQVHREHENNHDSDVAAAVASICECRIDLLHRKAILANLNPDQTSRANAAYTGLDDCIEEIVDANAEPAIERAWLHAHGGIIHNKTYQPHEPFITDAHNFATAYINLINNKTMGQRRGYKYQYTLCLIDRLNADRDLTGSARFLPKGVKLVKTKSTPADAKEVTLASLFTKLRNIISPVEGAPKPAV